MIGSADNSITRHWMWENFRTIGEVKVPYFTSLKPCAHH